MNPTTLMWLALAMGLFIGAFIGMGLTLWLTWPEVVRPTVGKPEPMPDTPRFTSPPSDWHYRY